MASELPLWSERRAFLATGLVDCERTWGALPRSWDGADAEEGVVLVVLVPVSAAREERTLARKSVEGGIGVGPR